MQLRKLLVPPANSCNHASTATGRRAGMQHSVPFLHVLAHRPCLLWLGRMSLSCVTVTGMQRNTNTQFHTLGTRSRPWMSPLPASSQVSGVQSAQAQCAQRPPAQRLSTPPSHGHSAHAGGRAGSVVALHLVDIGLVPNFGIGGQNICSSSGKRGPTPDADPYLVPSRVAVELPRQRHHSAALPHSLKQTFVSADNAADRVGATERQRTQGADIAQPQAALRLVPYRIAVRMHLLVVDTLCALTG